MLRHTPILVDEILAMIPPGAEYFLDGTLGHGGHAEVILSHFLPSPPTPLPSRSTEVPIASLGEGRYVGVDRDSNMLEKAKGFLEKFENEMIYIQGSYAEMERITRESGVEQFDRMLLDIGVNMDHFKTAERGFSIKLNGPLDMRFDTSQGIPASEWLYNIKDKEFTTVLTSYTDFSPKFIEKFIKAYYQNKTCYPTTHQFVERLHEFGMNDKVIAILFQSIRIAVNDELGELTRFLQIFYKYLIVGGRCCFLTFHSIEDRIVKQAFQKLVDTENYILINKHVITPNWQEKKKNKASSSCKMRVIQRIR